MKRVGDLQVLALLALAKLAFHLATSQGYGIFRDEYYYLACSDRLAWGYVDHPPLSIALLWVVRRTLGDSLPAIRFLVGVAGAASVFVAGLIARELGGRRGAQVLTGLTVFFAPYYLAVSHFYSMNAFDVLCWTVLELLAVRILWRDEPRLWVWFGVVAGLGLQNKYSVAFFAIGLLAGLLLTPQRLHLSSGWQMHVGALAASRVAPHVGGGA
ncbi:MAG: glycosyltransferase family 39 protein, partial [Candidatus Binatia bacterium]